MDAFLDTNPAEAVPKEEFRGSKKGTWPAAALAIVLLGVFTLDMSRFWLVNPEYHYGWIVPALVGFLLFGVGTIAQTRRFRRGHTPLREA
jgi:hypothetical protein